ncbi:MULTISPECIES: septum formation inhibitor Maf [unclassified Helicobacter]|uniref:septum formation inhibitor Maf n=1 Tax=unclassified Helicobacter TaxID=2593540 RepID=UPI000CF16E6B|nr:MULTISPECIES: septum formation inhibitor Maf [unclassified Helicobacter]
MIILASSSQSRKVILEEFCVDFVQKSVDFDEETIKTTCPKTFAFEACKGKFFKALQKFGTNLPILVADSVVSVNNILQRKPKNIQEARDMLTNQSGNEVKIITAQIFKSSKIELYDVSCASFSFKFFDSLDKEHYLESNLWKNKAGGIMLEGFHQKYIIQGKGLLSTARGLSIEKFLPFFEII